MSWALAAAPDDQTHRAPPIIIFINISVPVSHLLKSSCSGARRMVLFLKTLRGSAVWVSTSHKSPHSYYIVLI